MDAINIDRLSLFLLFVVEYAQYSRSSGPSSFGVFGATWFLTPYFLCVV